MDFYLTISASFRVFRSSAHMAVTGICSALDTWRVADIKWNNQFQLSLTNSCADEAVRSCFSTRLVKSNTSVAARTRCRTEVGRCIVTAPAITLFVAVGISRDMKTFVE